MNKFVHSALIVIVLIGFFLRLYKIQNPVADWHSWRQADTAAVTRNYEKFGINILYPKYDDYSDVSGNGLFNLNGYRFVEFPIFNLVHFGLYKIVPPVLTKFIVAGSHVTESLPSLIKLNREKLITLKNDLFITSSSVHTLEIWGRLTSVIFACISMILIYFLTKRHSAQLAGVVAAFIYAVLPYNVYFTRVILPDPAMTTFFLATLNAYDKFNQVKNNKWLFITAALGACAVLIKPVAIFFLLPITLTQLRKHKSNLLRKKEFWLLHISFILPFLAWRTWSHRHPEGIPASTWLLNGNHIRFKPSFFNWIFGERVGGMILGKWGLFPALVGIGSGVEYLLYMIIGSLAYLCVVATGNVQHDYYQIAIVPCLAMAVGIGFNKLWNTKVQKVLAIICVVFMSTLPWYSIRGLYQINNYSIILAGQAVDKIVPKDATIIAPYQGDTAFLYQTNRPGFAYLYPPLKDMIDNYKTTYYVSVNYDDDTNAIMKKYTIVEQKPEYVIVKLEEKLRNNQP